MPMNQSTDSTSSLRGDQRDAEHQQEIAERQRRIGRLRDEHHRQRQVDGERIQVERIAGGDHEAHD